MVASALAAAGALGGGLLASRGAQKAADTTAQAANRAADLNMQQYLLSREDMSPWRYAGQNALQMMLMGTLGLGLPGTTGAAPPAAAPGGVSAPGGFPMPNGIGGGIGALPDRWWENPYYSGQGGPTGAVAPGSGGTASGFAAPKGASPSLSSNIPRSFTDPAQNRNAFMNLFQTSPDYNFRLGEGVRALDRSAAARGMLGSGAQLRGVTDYAQNTASGEYNNWYNKLASLAGIGQTSSAQTGQLGQGAAQAAGSNLVTGNNAAGALRASGYNNLASGLGMAGNNLLYGLRSGGGSGFGLPFNFGWPQG